MVSLDPRDQQDVIARRAGTLKEDGPLSSHAARNRFNALQCILATSLLSTRLSPGSFSPLPPPPGRLLELEEAPFIRLDDAPNELFIGNGAREGENADPPYCE